MLTVTRRGLLVLGGAGAAGVAVGGCSEATEPREDASAEDLTTAEAEAEANLARAYTTAAQATSNGEQRRTLDAFAEAAKRRGGEIAGGSITNASPEADGGPDAPEALSACQHLANAAIAAHLDAAGLLDDIDGRALAGSLLAACAAELAIVNGFAGDPEVPHAFVTGASNPYEDDEGASEESSTTSTTSSSTTDTTEEK